MKLNIHLKMVLPLLWVILLQMTIVISGVLAEEPAASTGAVIGSKENIEAFWQEKVDEIDLLLQEAITLYKEGAHSEAKRLILKAQYDGYKNSLLETAVRRNVSSRKDYRNNSQLAALASMVDHRQDGPVIKQAMVEVVLSLRSDLPGLPLIEGALSKKDARRLAGLEKETSRDWNKDLAGIKSALNEAVTTYGNGKQHEAIEILKDTYFSDFEESGLGERLTDSDNQLTMNLESGFNTVFNLIESKETTERVKEAIDVMLKNLSGVSFEKKRVLAGTSAGGAKYFIAVFLICSTLLGIVFVKRSGGKNNN